MLYHGFCHIQAIVITIIILTDLGKIFVDQRIFGQIIVEFFYS